MADWKPNDSDIIRIFEAHGLIPEGPMFDEALGLASMYSDLILGRLNEVPESVNRKQALLVLLEEGLKQKGIIPNSQEKQFKMPKTMK